MRFYKLEVARVEPPPKITSVTPTEGATFYESGSIIISSTLSSTGSSPLEYQFSIDGIIKQAWSAQANYTWAATACSHKIKTEVRNISGQDGKEAEIYVFRKPIPPPQ